LWPLFLSLRKEIPCRCASLDPISELPVPSFLPHVHLDLSDYRKRGRRLLTLSFQHYNGLLSADSLYNDRHFSFWSHVVFVSFPPFNFVLENQEPHSPSSLLPPKRYPEVEKTENGNRGHQLHKRVGNVMKALVLIRAYSTTTTTPFLLFFFSFLQQWCLPAHSARACRCSPYFH